LLTSVEGQQFATYNKVSGILKLHSLPPQTVSFLGLESLFTMPSPTGYEYIIGVTADYMVVQFRASDKPELIILRQDKLLLPYSPRFILPVDPMAWGHMHDWTGHDVLLSISEQGEIAFWLPDPAAENGWKCTRKVRTARSGFRKVRCSSAKKTALSEFISYAILNVFCFMHFHLVVGSSQGDELTIWDSTESEFSSGLEYRGEYRYEKRITIVSSQ